MVSLRKINSGREKIGGKKAQITLFIIISIVVIAVVGILFFIRAKTEAGVSGAENIPQEAHPLNMFVESCLRETAETGLRIIGERGGYINPEENGINANEGNPTESNAVYMSKDWIVPYWFYMESENSCKEECVFKTAIPSLRKGENSIEKQLERYIEKNIGKCFNDFTDFKKQGYSVESTEPKADVVIGKNDISIILENKIVLKRGEIEVKQEKFYTRLDVNLDRIYRFAKDITEKEIENSFLEWQTLNLIAGFSGVNKGIPPMSDVRFELGGSKIWEEEDVKEKIKGVLMAYVKLIQVNPSLNYRYRPAKTLFEAKVYNGMVVYSNQEFSRLGAYFNYLGEPIYFNLNCNGECKATSIKALGIIPIGIKKYDFVYDVSYPVIAKISDPDAFNGKGYNFIFGLEANIRNNEPFKPSSVIAESIGGEASLFCKNKNSGNISIKIEDLEGNPIEGVSISYKCGNALCSDFETNQEGISIERFPVCLGGVLILSKEGYVEKQVPLDVGLGESKNLEVKLSPKKEIKFEIRKKIADKTRKGWKLKPASYSIDKEDYASIQLVKISKDESFVRSGIYYGNQTEPSTLLLAPGDYDMEIVLVHNKEVRISSTRVCKGSWWDEECFSVPGFVFNSSQPLISGAKLRIRIKPSDLNAEKLVFYSVFPNINDLGSMLDYNSFDYKKISEENKEMLKPSLG